MIIKSLVGFWVLARMIFHMVPGNNPNEPSSLMSPMHAENVRMRRALGRMCGGEARVRVEWTDIRPSLVAFVCSVLSTVVIILFRR